MILGGQQASPDHVTKYLGSFKKTHKKPQMQLSEASGFWKASHVQSATPTFSPIKECNLGSMDGSLVLKELDNRRQKQVENY